MLCQVEKGDFFFHRIIIYMTLAELNLKIYIKMNMQRGRVKIYLFLMAMAGVFLFSAYRIDGGPQARSDGRTIVVTWSMIDESDVLYYEVLRKAGPNGNFGVISPQIQKRGNNSTYEYKDLSVFKSEDGIYFYKVRLVTGHNPAPETSEASVSFLSSAAKRTWGSIKAMFR